MKLRLIVETTSDYKKSGIYLAERADPSKPIIIDWGDGTIEQVNAESISQKVHEYVDAGTFNVAVDNIKTFMASRTSDWSDISSQNSYTLKEVVSMQHMLQSIEDYAFCYCNCLTSIVIPNSVTSIGDDAFSNCKSLTGIVIPDSVTSIERGAFQTCTALSDIVIPDNATYIGTNAFGLTQLQNVTIGKNVLSIENGAFATPTSNMSVYYTADVPKWCNIYFSNTAFPSHRFYIDKEEIVELAISSNIANIQDYTFDHCISLTSVNIYNSVTTIGKYAFSYCSYLKNAVISNSVTSIGTGAFNQCSSLTSITIGNGIAVIGANAFQKCSNLKSMQIDRTVDYVQSLSNYSWNLPTGCSITCTDGTIVI